MIINYILVAWRSLVKQKLYSAINITGLAVGLAVCMMIMTYVAHEMSYDRFHKAAGNIFMLTEKLKMQGQDISIEQMSFASGTIISQRVPDVSGYVRVRKVYKPVVVENADMKGAMFSETKMLFADANFFRFFTFKLVSGSPSSVLDQPFSIVLSRDMATKYFGTRNPIGKTLQIKTDSLYTYHVTGIAENAPSNSSIEFNFVASNASLKGMSEAKPYLKSESLQGGAFLTYLFLKHPADSARVQRSIRSLMAKNASNVNDVPLITALTDIHLHSISGDSSSARYLKIFPLVAGLILLLGLVNYMSLTTARSTLRAKEVGVRKVAGASRKSIALQFYIESALFTMLAFVLAYVICFSFEPMFLNQLQLKIDNSFLYSPLVLLILVALLLVTLIIAGSYPAAVLSAFKPVVTLKGKMGRQSGGVTVRKVFATLQFTIATGLIICAIIIDRQLYYFRHTDTGVNRENVVMVPISSSFGKQYQSFKKDVLELAGVNSVATSHYPMYKGYDMFFIQGKTKNESMAMPILSVDEDFLKTLNVQWKLPPAPGNSLTEGQKVIINEETIGKLRLPNNPIGSFVAFGPKTKYQIAGVVKNFNYNTLESEVGPLCLFVATDTASDWGKEGGCLFAKIKPHINLPTLIGHINSLYIKYDRQTPFSYQFMDDAFNDQYQAEDRLAAIFSLFTYITIALATLGLFGLAAFTIEQRTKEIGVRKILGASLVSINVLLSKDFLVLVLLATLIASPIAWWSMHKWLQNFAYRIHIQWWVFAMAGLVTVITAIITVSYHSIRAAIANPVKSLRSE
jgi:putative ABC transport system permease protein